MPCHTSTASIPCTIRDEVGLYHAGLCSPKVVQVGLLTDEIDC